jgi:hypothetical protein
MQISSIKNISENIPGIFVYFRGRFTERGKCLIDERLRGIPGIVAPWQSPHASQLIMIYYNPLRTNLHQMLKGIRAYGYDACFIEM